MRPAPRAGCAAGHDLNRINHYYLKRHNTQGSRSFYARTDARAASSFHWTGLHLSHVYPSTVVHTMSNDYDASAHDSPEASSDVNASEASGEKVSSPAARLPGLQHDESRKDLAQSSARLRDLLIVRPANARNLTWATLSVLGIMLGLLAFTGRLDTLAHGLLRQFNTPQPSIEPVPDEAEDTLEGVLTLTDSPLHPDYLFRPYLSGPVLSSLSDTRTERIQHFRTFLDVYVQSRGEDSNFDVRVIDKRTHEVLEVFTLEEEKAEYERLGEPLDYNWGGVDALRRRATNRLVDKWAARGIPVEAIGIRWGRAEQVRAAHRRALPYIEYEMALARYLGLSLLPTALSIQETFNQDKLVSSVGARSRYQMMPYLLRQEGIHHYRLATPTGNTVRVYEEWHPLLTMEPSFLILKGYINAVGHEIPGLSAYHTGPSNIYTVYQEFLAHESEDFSPATNVMDAYMWAVTDGFEAATEHSTFGPYSRKYVASIYGMFKGRDELPLDTSMTMRADRLQLKPGTSLYLSELLRALGEDGKALDWGPVDGSLYDRFRYMNPHFDLPRGAPGPGGVPVMGDVKLVAEVDEKPVRFFLPPGADALLRRKGYDFFDRSATFTFDHDTYPNPARGGKTMWDRQYDALVEDTFTFGFTPENREQLFALRDRFEQMAREIPTHYWKAQLEIINTHPYLWSFGGFDELVATTEGVMGGTPATVVPPAPLTPISSMPALQQLR